MSIELPDDPDERKRIVLNILRGVPYQEFVVDGVTYVVFTSGDRLLKTRDNTQPVVYELWPRKQAGEERTT